MKKLLILGGSGIGMIAASIALDLGYYQVIGFLNDSMAPGQFVGNYRKFPVVGRTEDVHDFLQREDLEVFVAYVGLQKEKETFEKIESLQIPLERFATLVHPSAFVPKEMCSIGHGVLMAPLSQLSPDTTVGDNCILLANSFLGHDSTMGKFSHMATNSVAGANVRIGRGVHVGSNATIREKVEIGDFSLIGIGSVVLKDVPQNSVIIGNPARVLKQR